MVTRNLFLGGIGALGLAFGGGAIAGECGSSKSACGASQGKNTHTVAANAPRRGKDIVDTAVGAGSFNTLVAAVKAAGLVDTLKGDGPFTVFAPTDEAFKALPAGTLDTLLKPENKGLLTSILTYHVVPGRADADAVLSKTNWTTVNGQRVDISVDNGTPMIDGASIVTTDIECSNGVIHVIDRVILPSSDDLIDMAVAAGQFKTLAAAIDAAGLVSTLQGDGPFTVFAPTDAAFRALPKGTVESLLRPENRDQLKAVLTYHVVSGRVYASDALSAGVANTVEGSPVRVTVKDGRLMVNDAKVVSTDIEASNGVIHVIDKVILPGSAG